MTNKEKIAEIEKLLAELKIDDEEDSKENKTKRWRAKDGGDYWHVSNFNTCCLCSDLRTIGCDADNFRYDTHNYFQNKEEAQGYVEVLETERQLKKFADEHNDEMTWKPDVFGNTYPKWHLIWNNRTSEASKAFTCDSRCPRTIYFSSKGIADEAIEEIGKDKVAKYLKYEW